jgi:N-carbamoyl-L-amino-acid hydrolase
MLEAGLLPVVDAATNLIGRRRGTSGSERWLATGSHLDTVVEAGALDGAYGVVAAVEAADALRCAGEWSHGLAVVAFANEEGARGTDGMLGSRALMSAVSPEELQALDDAGVSVAQRLLEAGGDPNAISGSAWDVGSIAGFLELHVEQGPVLDAGGLDLGVVTGIAGRQAVDIEIFGAANHAGTTPMDLRYDALVAAAEVVLGIESLARGGAVRVATCGHLELWPNVRNVVPGRVLVSAELRDQSAGALADARPLVEHAVAAAANSRGLTTSVVWRQYVAPVAADPVLVEVIEQAAARTGLPWCALPSGAGHDAQILGAGIPMGMIFVPSVGGVSHSPREHTEPAHLVAGAQLLVDSMIDLDRRLAGTT